MTLNPLKWIEWLITEHGSSAVLRERLGQAKDQIEILKSERADLKSRLEKAEVEIGTLKKENNDLRKKIGGVGAVVG